FDWVAVANTSASTNIPVSLPVSRRQLRQDRDARQRPDSRIPHRAKALTCRATYDGGAAPGARHRQAAQKAGPSPFFAGADAAGDESGRTVTILAIASAQSCWIASSLGRRSSTCC